MEELSYILRQYYYFFTNNDKRTSNENLAGNSVYSRQKACEFIAKSPELTDVR